MASMEGDPTECLKSTAVSGPKAVDAAETIAGMRWEYAAHAPDVEDMPRSWLAWGRMTYQKSCAVWVTHPDMLTALDGWKDHFVIARRLVSEPEEME